MEKRSIFTAFFTFMLIPITVISLFSINFTEEGETLLERLASVVIDMDNGWKFFIVGLVVSVTIMTFYSVLKEIRRQVRLSTLSDLELENDYVREEISKIRRKLEREKNEETATLLRDKELELQEKLSASYKDNLCDREGNISTDWREALLMSRRRLFEESRRLAARSSSNLTTGIIISSLVVLFLITLIFVVKPNITREEPYSFWVFYGPRFTLVVVLQLLAGFFLRLFVRNERDIQKNKNEITNLELRLAAGMMVGSNKTKLAELAGYLIKEERNFVITKKEKSALPESNEIFKQALELAKTAVDK